MKKTGWIVAVVVAAGVGYFVRGKLPAGAAPAAGPAGWGAMPPPVVGVLETRLESASPVVEHIAHVEPIQLVKLQAQVEGVIEQVHFKEGSQVKKGDLLFTIDPAPYQARVAQRNAELAQAQAGLDRSEKYLSMLNAADNRSVSKSDLDSAEAGVSSGRALLQKAQAELQQAEIDLGYTQIASPIDGRIGRALITGGNLVGPASGTLATVVQTDPMRIVFALPDAEYLTALEKVGREAGTLPQVRVRLANGSELVGEGELDFDDNQMDPATGTIAVRMRFANPDRLLVANNFVTALIQERDAPQRVVLPVEAILRDGDGAYVWVLKEDDTAAQVRIVTGQVIGSRQIIESGLDGGERVVVSGTQKVRPGVALSPQDRPNL